MFTNLELAIYSGWVKPSMVWQRDNQSCRTRTGETGSVREGLPAYHLNHSNRPVRARMPGGVAGAQSTMAAPYPDFGRTGSDWSLPMESAVHCAGNKSVKRGQIKPVQVAGVSLCADQFCCSSFCLISTFPDFVTNSTPATCWSACSAMFSSSIRNTPLIRMLSNDGSESLIGVLR